jgi:hypothetical protein
VALIKLQIILLVFSVLGLTMLIKMISQYKLELKYALLWVVISIMAIILSIFPAIINFVARVIGVESPVNALFLIAIICAFLILFSLTVAMSRTSTSFKNLVQEQALKQSDINELKKMINEINKENKQQKEVHH